MAFALLPRLRAQAGLSLTDLTTRLLRTAGLGPDRADKAQARLEAMERGDLDATDVSYRVVSLLGRLLNIGVADLTRIGTPSPARAGALYRRQGEAAATGRDLELLAHALAMPTASHEWDQVDELFFGPR